MNKTIAFIFLTCGLAMAQAAPVTAREALSQIESRMSANDGMGARIWGYRLLRLKPNFAQWSRARALLHANPGVGFDLLYAFDKMRPSDGPPSPDAMEQRIQAASRKLKQKQFVPAFREFQQIAQVLKAELNQGHLENQFLYHFILHSMARSLYGAGRYEDALEVYQWITPLYPKYRQVLFERMWAAFRAGRIDFANGAIASQYSSYFTRYLEPETYLVQIYLYKKLCRRNDLQIALNSAKAFQKELQSNKYLISKWARSEVETRVLWNVALQSVRSQGGGLSVEERVRERKLIISSLLGRYKIAKTRFASELDKVGAYTELAFAGSSRELPAIDKLPSYEESLRSGLEIWPVGDAEDWLDEFGFHRFIGDSQCGGSRRSS